VNAPRIDAAALGAIYGAGAETYDALWHPVIRPPALTVIREMDLGASTCVLDVGAGTGALTGALREAAPSASIFSLDASRAMLQLAQRQARATTCVADAARLPVGTGSVDAVLLAYVLFHLVVPAKGVGEAARVLRPGGRVGTVTWASETQPPAAAVWELVLDDLDVPSLGAHGDHSNLDREDHVTTLHLENGLSTLRVWRESVGRTFTPADYLRMRTAGGVGRARLALVDDATRGAAIAELDRRLSALAPDAFTYRGEVICAVSERPADAAQSG
jgi:SAM-dependent methyltransferase